MACRVYFFQNAEGTGLPPMECWLALRGLKTMALRMEKSVFNAVAIARFLDAHPLITCVNYPNLPGTPAAALNSRQVRVVVVDWKPSGSSGAIVRVQSEPYSPD